MSNRFSFPSDIDEPPMIMFWEFPAFAVSIIPVFIGIVMRDGLIMLGCIVATYLLLRFYKRMGAKAKRNEMKHASYALGFSFVDKPLKRWDIYKDYSGG